MSRKAEKFGIAAVAAAAITTFAVSESSGAIAQAPNAPDAPDQMADDSADPATATAFVSGPTPTTLTEERMPVFVAEEIVQPVPVADESEQAERADNDAQFENIRANSLKELVAEIPTQASLNREMECLAGTIYFEARGEPLAGQLAVAKVVMNRSASSRFPDGYCNVVFQRSQFSFVKGGRMPTIRRSTAAWRKAKAIATIAHEGLWESEARDSLYFHAKYVRPSWARKKTARATINTHIFYR